MLKDSIKEMNNLKTDIIKLKSGNEEKERKTQSEELATNHLHEKKLKLEDHMKKNYKIDNNIKNETIDELKY